MTVTEIIATTKGVTIQQAIDILNRLEYSGYRIMAESIKLQGYQVPPHSLLGISKPVINAKVNLSHSPDSPEEIIAKQSEVDYSRNNDGTWHEVPDRMLNFTDDEIEEISGILKRKCREGFFDEDFNR